MKPPLTFKFTVVAAVAIALHSTSAQQLPVGDTAAFDPSTVLQMPVPVLVETLAIDQSRIIGTQTSLVRLQATEYQRKIAEQRARAYFAAQKKAQAVPSEKTASKPKTSKSTTAKVEPEPKKTKETAAEVAVSRKKIRYLAVETVKDKRSAPDVKKVIMIWDTQTEALVGNNLYDLKNTPPTGTVAKFETYSAEYIGAGL